MQRRHVLVLIRVYQLSSPRWFQQHEEMPVQNRLPLGTLTNIRIWSDVLTNIAIPIKLAHPRVIHKKKKAALYRSSKAGQSCHIDAAILDSLSAWASEGLAIGCQVCHTSSSEAMKEIGDQSQRPETMTYLASALSRVTAPSVAALPWGEGKQQSVWKLPFAQIAGAHLAETTEPEEQKNES